jgi:hypothetical protein
MAETLTVDPTPPVEIVGEQAGVELSADEQDSLAVGEQIVEQQEQLLAGKYKDAEALEKAYINLQKKLGEDGKEESKAEAEQEEVLPEESEESTEEPSEAATLITSASEEFAESGKLTAETLEKFNQMSSKDLVEAYMKVQASLPDEPTQPESDITDATVNQVKNFAGGEQSYQNIVNWASQNLDQTSIDAFDGIIGTGNLDAIKLAVNGLKSQYESANGYEGTMVTGRAPVNTKDVYRSQAELVRAMSDKRYDNDPAYRQDVIAKLERSDNLQF